MKTAEDLRQLLTRIDRKGYPAYKDTKGIYRFQGFVLGIDHVQGDPFAAPSRLHVEVGGKTAGFPERLYDKEHKRIALQDELIRQFAPGSFQRSCLNSCRSVFRSPACIGIWMKERQSRSWSLLWTRRIFAGNWRKEG